MLNVIRKLLLDIVDRIDKGTSSLTEEEALEAISLLRDYTDKDVSMSKYSACQYLNISRATFDNHIRKGDIPKGRKIIGFTELFWYKKDLDRVIGKFNKT